MTNITNLHRDHFIDLVKAIAIIMVVVGHCIQYGSGATYLKDELFFDNNLFKFIYSFHMPLFMLISGYLFANGINKGTKQILINKFKSLIIPIFVWATLPLVIYLISQFLSGTFSIYTSIRYYLSYCIYSLWFLWAVFLCSLIVVIVNRLFRDSILIYVIIFVTTFITPDNYNFDLYKFMYPFFVLGYFYKKNKLNIQLANIYKSNHFVFVSIILFLILFYFYDCDSYIYVSHYTIIGKNVIRQLCIDLYRYAIGITGSISALTIIYRLYNNKTLRKSSFLMAIGKNTMGIYIISSFLNTYVLNKASAALNCPNYLIIIIESISIIFMSILLIKQIQRHYIFNKYLLGGKRR